MAYISSGLIVYFAVKGLLTASSSSASTIGSIVDSRISRSTQRSRSASPALLNSDATPTSSLRVGVGPHWSSVEEERNLRLLPTFFPKFAMMWANHRMSKEQEPPPPPKPRLKKKRIFIPSFSMNPKNFVFYPFDFFVNQ
ncbi:hypothetical protein AVEN_9825-1 [Araneus ventricosus]|uniref:Uncharacterized protein n=1 Tax=Araneus ventricosus TaxID=182803 RepID=A0A4Y2ENZ4_ARAVE|nr:hypothetical protein AVEN_9825-1 [Araneus ventricosus]